MRKIFVAMLFSLVAVLGRAYADIPMMKFTLDPANGAPVEKIEQIRLTFTAVTSITPYDASGWAYNITLTETGSGKVYYGCMGSKDFNSVSLRFAETQGEGAQATVITAPGTYELSVPARTFRDTDDASQANLDITETYTIAGSEKPNPMAEYTLSPAAGPVNELSVIRISFPKALSTDMFHEEYDGIALISESDPSQTYPYTKIKYDWGYSYDITFPTITEPGRYRLHIPAGAFKKDFASDLNPEINEVYEIKAPSMLDNYVLEPESGAAVGSITTVSVRFPDARPYLAWPIEGIDGIRLQRRGSQTVYKANTPVLKDSENRVSFGFTVLDNEYSETITLTEPGEYDLTIPAGLFRADGTEDTNMPITAVFTVDPKLNFSCTFDPAPEQKLQALSRITVSPAGTCRTIAPTADAPVAIIYRDATAYDLTAVQIDPSHVALDLPADAVLTPGEWTVQIQAGYFTVTDDKGNTFTNHRAFTRVYTVAQARTFSYTVSPKADATINFFSKFSVDIDRACKAVETNPEAGKPALTNGTDTYELQGQVSYKTVEFTLAPGQSAPSGSYSVVIPAGYILTVDDDNLHADVPEIRSTFKVEIPVGGDFDRGILFVNEGWLGHDNGSLNFVGADYSVFDNAFAIQNPGLSLGVTSQSGQCFGDNVYVVSKNSDRRRGGGYLTGMTASNLKQLGTLMNIGDNTLQAHYFCGIDAHRGYLATNEGIYTVNLDTYTAGKRLDTPLQANGYNAAGDMLRIGDRVLALKQWEGILVFDTADDRLLTTVEAVKPAAVFMTADGGIYVATADESAEFVRLDPETFRVKEIFDIDANKAKVDDNWETFRVAPLAADRDRNVVYYTTLANPDVIAAYDFDTRTFTPDFYTLPEGLMMYGSKLSVDPATGYLVLTAVESGWGEHFAVNRVLFVNPADASLVRTVNLPDQYYFPAQALYPAFSAPELDLPAELSIDAASHFEQLDLAAATTLPVGNPHLVAYTVAAADPAVVSLTFPDRNTCNVIGMADGATTLTVTADYQGKTATANITIKVGSAGVENVATDAAEPATADVYNLQGVCVMRAATADDVRRLAPGIYIRAGRKFRVF